MSCDCLYCFSNMFASTSSSGRELPRCVRSKWLDHEYTRYDNVLITIQHQGSISLRSNIPQFNIFCFKSLCLFCQWRDAKRCEDQWIKKNGTLASRWPGVRYLVVKFSDVVSFTVCGRYLAQFVEDMSHMCKPNTTHKWKLL